MKAHAYFTDGPRETSKTFQNSTYDLNICNRLFYKVISCNEGKEREGNGWKGREWKGRELKGREGKGMEGKGREGKIGRAHV